VILLLGSALGSEAGGNGGSAESLAAAEKTFAHEAAAKGTRTAFLHVLAEDGIVFNPGPENGRKVWEAKPESKDVLKWEPVLAATATGGDLGYTTGPWSYTKDGEKEAKSFGEFVSIWRWEKGTWKLIFDLGQDTPWSSEPRADLQLVENHAPHIPGAEALPVMVARDRQYLADPAGEVRELAEENARFYRPGKLPLIGVEAALPILPKGPGPLHYGEPKTGISKGGDLGYLWGEYTIGDQPSPGGYYLRIWRRNRAGEWNLALDLLHPR